MYSYQCHGNDIHHSYHSSHEQYPVQTAALEPQKEDQFLGWNLLKQPEIVPVLFGTN